MAVPAGIQWCPEFRRETERRTQYHFPPQLQGWCLPRYPLWLIKAAAVEEQVHFIATLMAGAMRSEGQSGVIR
jgi:hypothetical protein